VALLVLPLFALSNAGLPLPALGLYRELLGQPEVAGIVLGLVVGKPLGIVLASLLAVGLRLGSLPAATSWPLLGGAAMLCGIGFTMSLFTAQLAFPDPAHLASAKLAILAASVAAAALGSLTLLAASRRRQP
jgi:NhaA family Na+:H+ antiporter